jgi:hypothetical protein
VEHDPADHCLGGTRQPHPSTERNGARMCSGWLERPL